jgi:hypothetical protein
MADNLTTTIMCRLSRYSGASTSWNPKGLSRPVAGKLYLFFTTEYIKMKPLCTLIRHGNHKGEQFSEHKHNPNAECDLSPCDSVHPPEKFFLLGYKFQPSCFIHANRNVLQRCTEPPYVLGRIKTQIWLTRTSLNTTRYVNYCCSWRCYHFSSCP